MTASRATPAPPTVAPTRSRRQTNNFFRPSLLFLSTIMVLLLRSSTDVGTCLSFSLSSSHHQRQQQQQLQIKRRSRHISNTNERLTVENFVLRSKTLWDSRRHPSSLLPSSSPSSCLWSFYYDPNQGAPSGNDDNHNNDDFVEERNPQAEFRLNQQGEASSWSSSASPYPTPVPSLSAIDVATLCMDALQNEALPQTSLSVCFDFSSDRCRAAVGGTLDEFVKYASNPVFGALVHCQGYRILSVGPIIPGSQHRGEMQTVLIEIDKAMTVSDAVGVYNAARQELELQQQQQQQQRQSLPSTSSQRPSGRPTIEERMRAREERKRQQLEGPSRSSGDNVANSNEGSGASVEDDRRVFLWTMQKERRPPRQNCWLVHEVLHKRNAFLQTT